MATLDFYLKDTWSRTLNIISESPTIPKEVFDTYYATSTLEKLEKDEALVVVENFISFSILKNASGMLEAALESQLGTHVPIRFIQQSELEQEKIAVSDSIIQNEYICSIINPNYTFSNFVTGKSNAQAHLASLTVASNLGLIYNPLFIYGNSGLGKTHLLNAIGNYVHTNFPNRKVGFISGLDFVEGVSKSIKNKTIEEFKNSFKELDLLLVDDIQFIAGKEKTHEVFFTVFNELVNNRKQICITADRTPSEIKGLEERIISRFNQGLNVNIEAPEYETSINILKSKISNNTTISQTIDDEVLSYIATNFSQDVRSLEGAIKRLLFYAINWGPADEDHITLSLAVEAFKDQVSENRDSLSIIKIRKVVCDYYNLTKAQITSATRTKNIATARHIAMYLCRKLLDAPYKEIGNEFGKRDHSTVINACEKVEQLIKKDSSYLKAISEIESKIN